MFDTPFLHRAIDWPYPSGGVLIPRGVVDRDVTLGYVCSVFLFHGSSQSKHAARH
jgi:hypothetical protein